MLQADEYLKAQQVSIGVEPIWLSQFQLFGFWGFWEVVYQDNIHSLDRCLDSPSSSWPRVKTIKNYFWQTWGIH